MRTTAPDPQELRNIAERLRADTWELTERWSEIAARHGSASTVRGGDSLVRFGEIPSFLAALARHLEMLASQRDEHADTPVAPIDDEVLKLAAADHARQRATIGYTQRDMLSEFVALRRVLWEHFASSGADERPTFEGERIVNVLLDSVIVEAADQFFSELTDALVRRAERDPLTDLYNRQTFHGRLTIELARARRYGHELTVVVIDLDAFKQVNDTLGHLTGDAVLTRLATLLTKHTRDEDIVGRLGGDEFAVVLVETGVDAARDLIRRLRIHLTPAKRQLGLPKEFGISFGAATFPLDGETVEQLLFTADAGMYKAKGPGRGLKMHAAGHSPQVHALRVLVVDDDPGIRSLCDALLESQGFAVESAADGAAALRLIDESPPDVVLLDIAMPSMDGWEVVEKLRSNPITAGLPVVMMTGRADQENLDRADAAGAVAFVSKPFAPEELTSTVHEVIEMNLINR